MANLLELKSRIRSVNATKKITKAQELIATSRITKAQARMLSSKPYAETITEVLTELASGTSSLNHPLLKRREEPRRAAVLVITSDRGFSGGYNTNVLKQTEELQQLLRSQGLEPVLFVLGSKGLGFYNFRQRKIEASWTGFSQNPSYADAARTSSHLVELFMAGSGAFVEGSGEVDVIEGVDELHVVYTEFVSMLTQRPVVRRLAPLEVVYAKEDESVEPSNAVVSAGYEFEPSAEQLLAAILPKYISARIYSSMLDASAAESAARRAAMKAATDNANELVETLSREANQARQAKITQEISEIVGGANALADSDRD